MKEIAEEEPEHADKLAERTLEVGGQPIVMWDEVNQKENCKYPNTQPDANDLPTMAQLKKEDERCAIGVYVKLMNLTKDKDFRIYNLMMHILEEEVVHENKMMQFLGE